MSTVDIWGAESRVGFLLDQSVVKCGEQLTVAPTVVIEGAKSAAAALINLIVNTSIDFQVPVSPNTSDHLLRPQLVPPKQALGKSVFSENTQSRNLDIQQLLASMIFTLEQGGMATLAFNAQSAVTRDAVRNAMNSRLASEYESAQAAVADGLGALSALKDQLVSLNEKKQVLKLQLTEANATIAALDPNSPECEIEMRAHNRLNDTLSTVCADQSRVLAQVQMLQIELDNLQQVVNALLASAINAEVELPREVVKKDASNIARILALMTQLGELMMVTGEARAETQRAILTLQEEIRIKKLIADAKKADEELSKVEALNKTMGWIGKILGAVLTAVAVIGAVFTGGASLALAGIGLALMLGDQVYHSVTGNSFIAEAMKPIMSVLQPILQFVMDKVSAMLEGVGMDAQTAKMTAMIVVSVVIAAAVVLLTITGAVGAIASVAANLFSKLMSALSKALEKTMGRLVPEMLKKSVSQMIKELSTSTSKMFETVSKRLGLKTDIDSQRVYAMQLGRMAAVVNLSKTTIEGGLEVASQVANIEVAKAAAGMKFTMSELRKLCISKRMRVLLR